MMLQIDDTYTEQELKMDRDCKLKHYPQLVAIGKSGGVGEFSLLRVCINCFVRTGLYGAKR